MLAYGNRPNAMKFARANNSDLLRALKHLMETRLKSQIYTSVQFYLWQHFRNFDYQSFKPNLFEIGQNLIIVCAYMQLLSSFSLLFLGGGQSLGDVTPGKVAEFNMWDYEMTANQISVLPCREPGNISSWDKMLKYGVHLVTRKDFPSCKGKTQKYSLCTIIPNNFKFS